MAPALRILIIASGLDLDFPVAESGYAGCAGNELCFIVKGVYTDGCRPGFTPHVKSEVLSCEPETSILLQDIRPSRKLNINKTCV